MFERITRIRTLLGLGVLYLGLLAGSLVGGDLWASSSPSEGETADTLQTAPPRIVSSGSEVEEYRRRDIRSQDRRGGGLQSGK